MISLRPYDDHAAMHVLRSLDPNDVIEAQIVRGAEPCSHLAIFADWRSMQGHRLLSLILHDDRRGTPFAVLALAPTGQAGVAQAALLARNHRHFRRQLVSAGAQIRREMPGYCAQTGIRRIEARCWAGHPTAPRFLAHCGFTEEAAMPGFGEDGDAVFRQFAWVKAPRHPFTTPSSKETSDVLR